MKPQFLNRKPNKLVKNSMTSSYECFDFDLWAREVKRQMITALKKRASKTY